MNSTPEIILQAVYIELKRDWHGKTYFLIYDRDTGTNYYAFFGQVKKGWFDLATNWAKAKEVWIKFEKKKVIALRILKTYPRLPIMREGM